MISFPKAPIRQAFVDRLNADSEWFVKIQCDEPLPLDPCLAYAALEGAEANLARWFRVLGLKEGDWREYQSFDATEQRGRSVSPHVWSSSNATDSVRSFYALYKTSPGLYIIGNRLNPEVRFRAKQSPLEWQPMEQKKSTKDTDILSRSVLYIDIDAKRPDGISSTVEEMRIAHEVTAEIYDCFAHILGSETSLAIGHSGNGGAVFVATEALPNDEKTKLLFQNIIGLVVRTFKRGGVDIDEKVFDAKRLMPLFGTKKTKGSDSVSRPHRRTSIWLPGEEVERAPLDSIIKIERELTKVAPPPEESKTGTRPGLPSQQKSTRKESSGKGYFEHYGEVNHGCPIADVMERLGLKTGDAIRCPGCGTEESKSRGGSIAILDEYNRFKCSHNRCANKGREGARSAVDLVVESKMLSEGEAIQWLAEQFGITLSEPPKPERTKSNNSSKPAKDAKPKKPPYKPSDNLELLAKLARRAIECARLAIAAAQPEMFEITLRKQAELVSSVIAGTDVSIELETFLNLSEAAGQCASTLSTEEINRILDTAFNEGKKTPKQPPGLGAFPNHLDRGDEVELGSRLLDLLRELGPVKFDEGTLYEYHPHSGLWVEIEEQILHQYVQQFAGIPIGEDVEPKVLCLGDKQVRGAIRCANAKAFERGFFDNAPSGVGFINGFVRVEPGQVILEPHGPERRARSGLRIVYQKDAPCPMWKSFLDDAFRGDYDAEDKIRFLQEFLGACFLGIATRYQIAVVMTGEGANGKSTFIEILMAQFPKNVLAAVAPQDWKQEYRRAMLAGKRLNALSELPEQEIMESESFKAFISGDAMTGRHINKPPFMFKPIAGHLFAANQLPGTTDFTLGFWRRLSCIAFNGKFEGSAADKKLPGKIIAAESAGVISWMLEGAANLLARGDYIIPKSSDEAKQKWRQEADSVASFVEQKTSSEPENGRPVLTSASDLYDAYRQWAQSTGQAPVSTRKFARRMEGLGKPGAKKTASNFYPVRIVHFQKHNGKIQ